MRNELRIIRVENGYILETDDYDAEGNAYTRYTVCEETENDSTLDVPCDDVEVIATYNMLWNVKEHFFPQNKHDSVIIRIVAQVQNDPD